MSNVDHTLPRDTVIMVRARVFLNTDPQRRCYNGAYFSGHETWSGWTELEYVPAERAARRVEFWKELNDIAVKARGKGALREFKLEPAPEVAQ